jgi:hybrid cluster-associated redox disulfide protein
MNITKSMSIMEIVQKYPQTVEVFRNFGMGCLGCSAARFENVEQGAAAHGIDIEALIVDLNKVATGGDCDCGCGCNSK